MGKRPKGEKPGGVGEKTKRHLHMYLSKIRSICIIFSRKAARVNILILVTGELLVTKKTFFLKVLFIFS